MCRTNSQVDRPIVLCHLVQKEWRGLRVADWGWNIGRTRCLLLQCDKAWKKVSPAVLLVNVPQECTPEQVLADLTFEGLPEKACSSIQRSRRQAGGAVCLRMVRAVICNTTCDMFYICSLTDQVWCFAERTGQQASLDTKGHGKGKAPPPATWLQGSDSW